MTPRLIFLHLPRTGGTTLIYEHLFPGVPLDERYHANYDENMREIGGDDPRSWPITRRNHLRFLVGHMPFGLADLFEDRPST